MNPKQLISDHFSASIKTMMSTGNTLDDRIIQAALLTSETVTRGGKILSCGNGGSASDAQHFSSELVCRYELNRKALAAVALSSDASVITATGNDYDFSQIFSRQVEALGQPGDLLLVISTSGESENVILAAKAALQMNIHVVGLTGKNGGTLGKLLEHDSLELRVPSEIVAHIQEAHAIIIHCICKLVELQTMGELLS